MFDRRLIDQLDISHDEYNRTCKQLEKSCNYTCRIYQAISFKAFHDYLLLSDIERSSEYGEQRRLYEYTLNAVCSPLHVFERGTTTNELAAHVAKLFNVDPEEHEEQYIQAIKMDSWSVSLSVDVKRARNLPGEDQNGLRDLYCEVSVIHIPSTEDDSITKHQVQSLVTNYSQRSWLMSSRRNAKDSSTTVSLNNDKTLKTITYCTEVQPQTTNPEWNEHFDLQIKNLQEQHLFIKVLNSDHVQASGLKTGVARTFGIQSRIRTAETENDLLGQVSFDIKSLATFDCEQWFSLTGSKQNHSNNNESRGEILLRLKVKYKLGDKNRKSDQHESNTTLSECPRRHSSSSLSPDPINSSTTVRPVLFGRSSLLSAMQALENAKSPSKLQRNLSQSVSCLTSAADSDFPSLVEEYHQLTRIVMRHECEKAKEANRNNESNGVVINWNGLLRDLSYSVLTQFRVLYNISVLSKTFIHLLAVMELRCSDDDSLLISQSVIQKFLKRLMEQVRLRPDIDNLDFTDYE
ncbi:unnamed protein product, partial [Rotaria sp. Silwood1]